ncbi:MAG: hypothetical protein AAB801_02760 [Patescibacteria group bacterium]
MGYGGYFKGERKKPKKDKSAKNISLKEYSPFVLPELVGRKKKNY